MIESTSLEEPRQCRFSNGDVGQVADTSPEHGGSNAGIRPHELLEASLATCMNMTVRMVADREGFELEAVETTARLDRSGDQERIQCEVAFEGVDDREADRLLGAARQPPVHETLMGGVEIDVELQQNRA